MVIVGITGGVAAYKMASVVSYLAESQDVYVVMTESAKKFVGPITFSSLSRNPVIDDTEEWKADGEIQHILYSHADLLVIAPATANTIAKMANGIADNVLTSLYLAHHRKVLIFPAMNVNMYKHPATQRNLSLLHQNQNLKIIEPEEGRLACGDIGKGRLPNTKKIIEEIKKYL